MREIEKLESLSVMRWYSNDELLQLGFSEKWMPFAAHFLYHEKELEQRVNEKLEPIITEMLADLSHATGISVEELRKKERVPFLPQTVWMHDIRLVRSQAPPKKRKLHLAMPEFDWLGTRPVTAYL